MIKRVLFPIGACCVAVAAGCSSGPSSYGRVWITNAVAVQPADLLAEFGGPAPVSPTKNPTFGACELTTTGAKSHYSSAGTVQVSGTGGPWQLVPDSTGAYRATASAPWNPGTTLTVQASGGAVPAFTGAFVVPPALVYDAARADLLAAIAGGADVVLHWTPLDAQNIWVGVQADSAEVSCSFKGSDGAGTIPGAALASLPAARTIKSVASNGTELVLGDWWVHLLAQSAAQLSDGSLL